ncbi:MAG: serine/threonine-protein kinase [Gemmatimonadales bacterium]|nr:serine/threonine-protein kinase [Gemmatimonadales bacterium]
MTGPEQAELPGPAPGPGQRVGALDHLEAQVRDATAGTYEVIRELGRGGMGAVFLARDVRLDRLVALKALLPALRLLDPRAEARFLQEARLAAGLQHRGTVSVFGVEETEAVTFMVMQFVDGPTLAQVLKARGRLSVAATAAVLRAAGEALDHAHAQGLVHRDVKPSNVLLDRGGELFVSDFGAAKEVQAPGLTTTGGIIGTPPYMAPEQATGERDLTGACDQYALGVVAFELLTGALPFNATSPTAMMMLHVSEPPPVERLAEAGVEPPVRRVVARMLAKAPTERYRTVREAAAAFAAAADAFPAELVERGRRELRAIVAAPSEAGTLCIDSVPTTRVRPAPSRRALAAGVAIVLALSGMVVAWRSSTGVREEVAPPTNVDSSGTAVDSSAATAGIVGKVAEGAGGATDATVRGRGGRAGQDESVGHDVVPKGDSASAAPTPPAGPATPRAIVDSAALGHARQDSLRSLQIEVVRLKRDADSARAHAIDAGADDADLAVADRLVAEGLSLVRTDLLEARRSLRAARAALADVLRKLAEQ